MIRHFLASTALTLALTAPALAQDATDTVIEEAAEIVVTAQSSAGSVDTDVPPDLVLTEDDIASYGASNLTDLVAALSTQTRSGRGRDGGAPVVLVNGRRVSGFSEIRDLPPEAILKVETFPEEVALKFGFSPDQRVINFILKDDFRAVSAEVEIGGPTRGGRLTNEIGGSIVRITGNGRINLSVEYERDSSITEAERGIAQPIAGLAQARTLAPETQSLDLNAVINRPISDAVNATLNLTYDRTDQAGLFGLSTGREPLRRDRLVEAGNLGVTLDGQLSQTWRWTATGTLGQENVVTLTDQIAGRAVSRDRGSAKLTTGNANLLLSGQLVDLPAGPVSASFRAGYERRNFRSRTRRSGTTLAARLGRGIASTRASLDIPLTSRRRAFGEAIGDLSVNVNGGYQRLTDFGGVRAYGYGATWSPAPALTLTASLSATEAAPSQQLLRDPLVFTPGVTIFDFVRGTTAVVTQISGGNSGLRTEDRRDTKVAASWQIKSVEGLGLSAEYFRNRAASPLAGFPSLTTDIEAAFPGRIVRDAGGNLVSVDTRSINYASTANDRLRFGLNFQRNLTPEAGRGGGRPGAGQGGPGGRPPGAGQGGGPRGGGGGFGRFGGGPGKRVSASLLYTHELKDEIVIAPGLPVLDLLNGGATGAFGGTSRHRVDLEGGWFNNGLGIRAIAAWQSPTTISGGVGSSDLRFGAIGTLNLRFFLNFDQRKKITDDVPFLKGSRISIRIDNAFDQVRDVRDTGGVVPFRFQPGFVDPLGRTIELSFRKLF